MSYIERIKIVKNFKFRLTGVYLNTKKTLIALDILSEMGLISYLY